MKIPKIKYLTVCFVCSCMIVCALQLLSSWKQRQPNGFVRLFPSHVIKGIDFLELDRGTYYIAGGDSTKAYLGNWAKHGRLLKVGLYVNDTANIQLSGYEKANFYQGAYLKVIKEHAYLIDENKPLIGSGTLNDKVINLYHQPPYFTAGMPLNPNSFVIRGVKNRQNYLAKFDRGKVGSLFKLEKQGDGIFSTDGSLVKADNSNVIFYIYFYRNQFLALDTNLKLLYKGKTKDTISQANIKVSRISSENQTTISSPLLIVNKQSTANEKYLFIHSALKADNETADMHEQGAAIDVYDVSDGKYKLSFYLPDFNGKKLTDFRVYGQSLYALYDHYLYKYQLNF